MTPTLLGKLRQAISVQDVAAIITLTKTLHMIAPSDWYWYAAINFDRVTIPSLETITAVSEIDPQIAADLWYVRVPYVKDVEHIPCAIREAIKKSEPVATVYREIVDMFVSAPTTDENLELILTKIKECTHRGGNHVPLPVDSIFRWLQYLTFGQSGLRDCKYINWVGSMSSAELADNLTCEVSIYSADFEWFLRLFGRTRVTQEAFDAIMGNLTPTQKVTYCHELFHTGFDRWCKLKFTRKHVGLFQDLLKLDVDQHKRKILRMEWFNPDNWDLLALSELFHLTTDKAHFVLYAAVMRNHQIVGEVLRMLKAYEVEFGWLGEIYRCAAVTNTTLTLPFIGRFVEYISAHAQESHTERQYLIPSNVLLPEWQGYYTDR
jgi:hypothetical protein